ncbi:MAG TPA: DEAD/DEAH box helicase [Acidimicrobiia bacterium]|nr:DEAD/DEAH box helicase [Acidimicrobiia bacterium]
MTTTFGQLGLPTRLVDVLASGGITEPFPIQTASIPDVLAGRDVCAKAPTGSGKTLAFGLGVLSSLDAGRGGRPRALVLVPTRELADQIVRELGPLAKAAGRRIVAVYGGVGYGPQKSALRRGADLVVATPGRLEDLISQRSLDLGEIDVVVLDEADRMADMGFLPAVRRIMDLTPRDRQTLLFSATLDGDIAVLSRRYQNGPVRHETGTTEPEGDPATHHFWLVAQQERTAHVAELVASEGQSIVFTRTRHGADRLARQLDRLGVKTEALHGGRSQSQRNRALSAFSSGRVAALVATDVAARGIHVDAVAAVIHFDPPAAGKDYLHRSGRTARAGAGGKVVTLVTESQRRDVQKMTREVGLDARFEKPGKTDPVPSHRTPAVAAVPEPASGQEVYVANLPWSTTSDDLRQLFGSFGPVHQSTVVVDRRSGRSRGFGFVHMPPREAEKAIHRLNGSTLEGRDLTVRPARARSARS